MTSSAEQIKRNEQRVLLKQMLRDKARATVAEHPLSYGQRALWFIQQTVPDSPVYGITFAVRIHARIDSAAFERALQTLIDRHAALRTSFAVTDAGLVQRVHGYTDPCFEQLDATGWDEETLLNEVTSASMQPFDLENSSLLRVVLFSVHANDHVLLLAMHHIITDGWSVGVLMNELRALYDSESGGVVAALPPVRTQSSDHVHWQEQLLTSPDGQRLRTYWHQQLNGELPLLNLPIDRPRTSNQSFQGTTFTLDLGPNLTQQLRQLAQAERTTMFVVLLAGYQALLHRYSGQEDIIVGTPVVGRNHSDFQATVGYFINTVALRTKMMGQMSFHDLLASVRQTVHDAISHQDYPFALLVEELRPPRTTGRSAIIETMLNLRKAQRLGIGSEAASVTGSADQNNKLPMEGYPIEQDTTQFDLVLDVLDSDHTIHILFRYSTDIFTEPTIARLATHMHALLTGAVAAPATPIGVLPLLGVEERRMVLETWNATVRSYPADLCIHDMFAAQAARTPTQIAATFDDQSLSYAELDQRSNQLAHHLRGLGVSSNMLVGIYLERSLDMLVALFGVLKAGGAYLPLDPSFPRERLSYMLADSSAPVLITQASLADSAPTSSAQHVLIDADQEALASYPSDPPVSDVTPEHLAYVIYTSGSTGRPKGVQLPHRAVVNFLDTMREHPGLATDDVLLAVTTLSFDIAVLEIFLPLTIGARIVLVSRETASDGIELASALNASGASVLQGTPATWQLLLSANWQPVRQMRALCGGEPLPPDLASTLLELGIELWNMYGPTETTVWSTIQPVLAVDGPVPIGRPIGNTQVYVLNPQLQPQPAGVAGELFIGGDGVARGYLNRAELTAERFIADPFRTDLAGRMYRTGDLARFRPDGILEVLGRTDHQVKIRGFRIELGEIEAVLTEHPSISTAVVIDRAAPAGGRRLVAYLTSASANAPGSSELRRHLRGRLPEYMLPALFVVLPAIPRTPNGKVDRAALPAPERSGEERSITPPTTEMERALVAIWGELLGTTRIGIHDNFFDLGGHSLLAVEAMAKAEKQTGVKLNPAMLRNQALDQLAVVYQQQQEQLITQPVAEAADGLGHRLRGMVRRVVGRQS